MDIIAVILFLAVSIEGTVQWFKQSYREKWTYLALALGLIGVLATGFNPLIVLGVEPVGTIHEVAVALIGYLLGAVAISRGANYVNDFVGLMKIE